MQAWMPRAARTLRATSLGRVAAVGVVTALVSTAFAVRTFPASAVVIVRPPAVTAHPALVVHAAPAPRVLMIGDSVMDQHGQHAEFALRQAGIDAKTDALWGSSILTRDDYDFGKSKNGGWLKRAADDIASFNPDVVAVYLNHNYWEPYPRDAAGREIGGAEPLWSPAGQAMLQTQAAKLITILRARGARVFFVKPIPAGQTSNPDPNAWSAIWHGYLPVLNRMHVPTIDSSAGLRGPTGLRTETKPACTGAQERIRPLNDLHLTRFGSAVAGTALASALARAVGGTLRGNAAPGDHTVALVPTADGRGYWLVGCDGSIYHFGTAARFIGAGAAIARHHGVAAAAATPDGRGMWLVAADGTIASVGNAAHLTFRVRPASAVTGVSATADGRGLLATTAAGAVHSAGTARSYGSLAGRHLNGEILDIEPTSNGKGYWLVGADGGVFSFGNARFHGSMGGVKLNGRIVAIAATPDNRGYWQVGADGGIFAFGSAKYLGNGRYVKRYPYYLFSPPPGPAVDVIAAPGARQGYWVVRDTGGVSNLGAARGHEGTNGLALFSQ
jgi:hypothetical protein